MINRHPLMQNSKPVKALHTHGIWKKQHSGWCLVANIQHLAMPLAVFATQPHPLFCMFCTALTAVL